MLCEIDLSLEVVGVDAAFGPRQFNSQTPSCRNKISAGRQNGISDGWKQLKVPATLVGVEGRVGRRWRIWERRRMAFLKAACAEPPWFWGEGAGGGWWRRVDGWW